MYKSIHTEKFDVFALQVGMYISSLDIPWSATNYPLKGFMIENKEQISELIKTCNYVYIDTVRSRAVKTAPIKPATINRAKIDKINGGDKRQIRPSGGMSNSQVSARLASFATETYPVTAKFKDEIKVASSILEDSLSSLNNMLSYNRELVPGDMLKVRHLTAKMVSSAIRNPDALVWLCKIKNADKKIYNSLLSSAVTGIVFARHLGLKRDKIEVLAQSLMLRGIGLIKLDKKKLISYRPGKETSEYLEHVDLTLNTLSSFIDCDRLAINTIQNYCERFDGLGYPAQKPALRIPLLAQMMGIVVFFESSVNPIVESRAVSPAESVTNLFKVANKQFSKQLIEQFVQSVGIYPVGCVVQLSDNSLGMIIDQTPKQRLRPKVAVVKNEADEILTEPKIIDLANQEVNIPLTIKKGISRRGIPASSLNICISHREEKSKVSKIFGNLRNTKAMRTLSIF
ncbi:MAG: DUF3391 domain-containing protein [Kangiellaceae bacterium]|nr:DUF3391 domain-containing protein [Kangiellaceae bacterium]MCW8998074.1 DUF3391 domain-containing protein [Kangiellaceae bacterium]